MTIHAIDFGRLYRDHLAAASRTPKPASAWDTRVENMNHEAQGRSYATEFISHMKFAGATTLLDVGCGTGTICLPLAHRLTRVYGLDYSRGMLDAMLKNAAARGLANVEAIHLAWEDDWSEVPVCDIAVASRSTTVEDMATALAKLNAKARLRVYVTHLVGGRFIDPGVVEVLGRNQPALPDYIYIINILHGMGIHPRLDYIEQNSRLAGAKDFEDFAGRVAWTLGELSADELNRLKDWYQHNGQDLSIDVPRRWAFISWEPLKKCNTGNSRPELPSVSRE